MMWLYYVSVPSQSDTDESRVLYKYKPIFTHDIETI